jgi:UDP-sulfoquinovose synthase
VYDLTELAAKVQRVAMTIGLQVEIHNLVNPRLELEQHYYNPDHDKLLSLGYQPTHDVEAEIQLMLRDLMPHRERIESMRSALIPGVRWQGERSEVAFVDSGATPDAPPEIVSV